MLISSKGRSQKSGCTIDQHYVKMCSNFARLPKLMMGTGDCASESQEFSITHPLCNGAYDEEHWQNW